VTQLTSQEQLFTLTNYLYQIPILLLVQKQLGAYVVEARFNFHLPSCACRPLLLIILTLTKPIEHRLVKSQV